MPSDLIARLRANPTRAPEILALAAADTHGPEAVKWVDDLRSRYVLSDRDLAKKTKARHAALARFGGAATGVGGIVTFIPDLVSLLWIQSRLIFFVAAAYEFDPLDPMRPAELLVLRDLYDDPAEARRALDGTGRRLAEASLEKAMRGRDAELMTSLLRFAGKRATRHLAGRMIPGFAILFNSVSNERDTRRLADRAIAFYGR
jgi:EcsC protein family